MAVPAGSVVQGDFFSVWMPYTCDGEQCRCPLRWVVLKTTGVNIPEVHPAFISDMTSPASKAIRVLKIMTAASSHFCFLNPTQATPARPLWCRLFWEGRQMEGQAAQNSLEIIVLPLQRARVSEITQQVPKGTKVGLEF